MISCYHWISICITLSSFTCLVSVGQLKIKQNLYHESLIFQPVWSVVETKPTYVLSNWSSKKLYVWVVQQTALYSLVCSVSAFCNMISGFLVVTAEHESWVNPICPRQALYSKVDESLDGWRKCPWKQWCFNSTWSSDRHVILVSPQCLDGLDSKNQFIMKSS